MRWQDIAQTAAGTLPIWRDSLVMVLACVVIGCLWFFSAMQDT